MEPKATQGRIVLADVLDPQGRNRKRRPLVIVTPTEHIQADKPFFAVAITGTVPTPLPKDHVLLPFHAQGRVQTGLRKKCAAMCNWLVELRHEDIADYKGVVPTKILTSIIETVDSLK